MHEMSLCHFIADVVRRSADGRHVDVVRVRIGALRQVVPDSLEFCWTLLREHEQMPDAELKLELVSAEVVCRSCGSLSTITSHFSLACPVCEAFDVEVVHGNEFMVTSLDVT